MPSLPQRAAYAKGTHAEWQAVQHLQTAGYEIIAQRYKCAAGEIDIIAMRENVLAFIEVKARHTQEEALHSITKRQMQRIIHAAEVFLSEHSQCMNYDIRFDVITVTSTNEVAHIPSAFDADY
jgi:putative endonuclease